MWLVLLSQIVLAQEKISNLWIESDFSSNGESAPLKVQWSSHYWNQTSIQQNASFNNLAVKRLFQQNFGGTYLIDNTLLSIQVPVFYENYATLPFVGNPLIGIRNNVLFQKNRLWLGLDLGLPSSGDAAIVWNQGFVHSFVAFQYPTDAWNFVIQPSVLLNRSDIHSRLMMDVSKKISSKNQIVSEFQWLRINQDSHIKMIELGVNHQLPQSNFSISAGVPVSLQSTVSDLLLSVDIQFYPPEIIFNSTDLDKDNILDAFDICIDKAEDMDGFEDEDGCPDYDNDQDGVLDFEDNCMNESEDVDGFEDEDGCPDYDNDHDNILDKLDRCPNVPETINRYLDEDGCPDLGNDRDFDGDSILDHLDRCPFLAEDFDHFFDEDGCPEVDNDGDGQLDQDDYQPNQAD